MISILVPRVAAAAAARPEQIAVCSVEPSQAQKKKKDEGGRRGRERETESATYGACSGSEA